MAVAARPADAPGLIPGCAFGPYRIERVLGRGGMGEVYEATHLTDQRRVALKILTHRLTDRDSRARFLSEGRIAASITHANTVYVFGSDEIDGVSIITMELLAGGTLKDLVDREGPLAPAAAVEAILQVIAGLEAAQQAGILHRDVKPQNCFRDPDGRIKIGDFGLSISTSAREVTEASGVFQGTPQYAAPEQLRGEPLDVAADIYAVGGTLYFLLTGRTPFDAEDVAALLDRVQHEPPPSPRAFAPDVPDDLAGIVLRCLSKSPRDRPQTYAGLAADLEPFSSIAPRPASPGTRTLAGFVDGTVLAVVAMLVVLIRPLRQALGETGMSMVLFSICVGYFAATEGTTGASRGKALLGLRVIDRRNQRASPLRATIRATLFVAAVFGTLAAPWWSRPILLVGWFAGARRSNGYAALHDLATSTRVVRTSKRAAAPTSAGERVRPDTLDDRIGPYNVIEVQPSPLPQGIVAAADEILNRSVWIVWTTRGTASPDETRRGLSRQGRARWLGGGVHGARNWNAYEAIDGAPLTSIGSPRTWGDVRFWLHELAEELVAGAADGSLPRLRLDQVWVTTSGRVRLADWPLKSAGPEASNRSVPQEPGRFLHAVAVMALQATPGSLEARMPLSARHLIDRLGDSTITVTDARDRLAELCREPAEITRRLRAIPLLLSSWLAFLIGIVSFVMVFFDRFAGVATIHGDLSLLGAALLASGLAGIAAAAIVRGGPLLRFSRAALVTRTGAEASRWRAACRAALAWLPGLTFSALTIPQRARSQADPVTLVAAVVVLGILLAGFVYALYRPERGWPDHLAGTWLVPR